jgi:hypothetical protein
MAAKLTRLTQKNSYTTAPSGRQLYHLQFSLQAACPETFGYGLVHMKISVLVSLLRGHIIIIFSSKSRDSSVSIALGYGLDDQGSRVRFPAGAGNFSLRHRVQTGSRAHPASYQMGTRGAKLTTDLHPVPRSQNKWSYTSTLPIRLHGVVLS